MLVWTLLLACDKGGNDSAFEETDTDTDADTDTDTDSDADTDSDTDTDTDTTPDPGGDRDADGVSNADEAKLGTDPDDSDSDDDTYLDGWEVTEATDPLDYESRIYVGFWPYNPDKDSYPAVDWTDAAYEVGTSLPRFAWVDQYGDTVDVYDFAGHGKDVLFVPMAMWADACQNVSKWLSDTGDPYGLGAVYPDLVPALEAGEAYWITDLEENGGMSVPPDEAAAEWFASFPQEAVPVLVGDGSAELAYVSYAWPTFILLDEDLTIVSLSTTKGWYDPVQDLIDRL